MHGLQSMVYTPYWAYSIIYWGIERKYWKFSYLYLISFVKYSFVCMVYNAHISMVVHIHTSTLVPFICIYTYIIYKQVKVHTFEQAQNTSVLGVKSFGYCSI